MTRVKFRKGQQRRFLQQVMLNVGCPSLRRLRERGFDINYQTLKSYYTDNRTMPEDLVNDLCFLGKIDKKSLRAIYLKDHWGQSKGGKK